MTNTEIVKQILRKLEENHINLYHDVSKEKIVEYISKIKNLDSLNTVEFNYEMKKLFALFKDAHTSYFVPSNSYKTDREFRYIGGKVYINNKGEWEEVSKIGNLNINQIVDKIEEIINYETQEWCNYEIDRYLNNLYTYYMLNLASDEKQLVLTIKNGEELKVSQKQNKLTEEKRFIPYSFIVLDGNILYFKYRACFEVDEYKFSDFMKDVKKTVEEKGITQYIIDVRDNKGGNSEILNPFQEFVKKKGLNGVMLINNGVFSSGRFAVARFKKDFGILLIGEPTGGAAKSYGYNTNLQVEDKRFSAAIRLWDFSDIFGYEGAIQPDIYVPLTINDVKQGKDRCLEKAIEVLKEKEELLNE